MTFSVVGRSADGRELGVAVASKFLAVGSFVPAAEAEVGAIATQAYANLAWKRDALALLRAGRATAEVLTELAAVDPHADERQAGLVGREGDAATYTGPGCLAWAGGTAGRDASGAFAAQGNLLAGPQVVEAMAQAWRAAPELPLARRLLAALATGEEAGGDPRGRQSAALLVVSPGAGYGGGSDVLVDLRSDDAPAPIDEVARMLDLHDLYFGRCAPEDLRPLDGAVGAEVERLLAALGHRPAAAAEPGAHPLDAPLWTWMSIENYEERFAPGAIDPVVLEQLRLAAGSR